ncbi:hypothetical protein VIGAN_11122200 [Vigna angularis var. angularis]|uniref:Uncharacterized protein n=1 Tax=Vigna angularis var. angularis TaxID=157739 RepID=A0A0S3T9H0_PHAAN|nr:hypothetical protein VIGAN_11122200 [Vigna angularis var. angularis]
MRARESTTGGGTTVGAGAANGFYEAFYSAFDDQSAAMNSILKGKELFTQQALKTYWINLWSESGKLKAGC